MALGYPLSPLTGAEIMTVDGKAASYGQNYTQNVTVTGSGSVGIEFVFRAYGYAQVDDGDYTSTLTVGNCTLTVTYEPDAEPEPEPDPETVLESARLFCLYAPTEKKFDSNGICVLAPSRAVVSELAGGYYNLDIEHPIDPLGKWALIQEGSVIRSPIPPTHIPEITVPAASVWKVKSSVSFTPLYSRLPTYTAAKTGYDAVVNNPGLYIWDSQTAYSRHAYVAYRVIPVDPVEIPPFRIYEAGQDMAAGISPDNNTDANKWEYRGTVTDDGQSGGSASGGSYDPGEIAETLSANETITKIADYNGYYMSVRSARGKLGYVLRSNCEETASPASGITIPEKDLITQLFRVVSIRTDETAQSITIHAEHYSYDFQGNALFDCQLNEADPMSAIAILQGSLMLPDERQIVCDMIAPKVTADWSFKNPVYALLDPDEGLLAKVSGKLIRDNADFYLLDDDNSESGVRLAYGVNLMGVEWSRDIEDVITRIIPRAGDGNNGYLYLDELFVDSPHINDYPVIVIEVLDTAWAVGQEIELPDGATKTLTVEDCKQKMREDAEKRFTEDNADAVAISVRVQFILMGDTEEYAQYRGLQRLNLYDVVPINTGPSGLEITAQVSGYQWDAILRRYQEITIGSVKAITRKRIPGYRVNNASISIAKLAPSLANKIRGV